MKKFYELPALEIIRMQEEVVRASGPIFGDDSSVYSGDSSEDWGYDIWD